MSSSIAELRRYVAQLQEWNRIKLSNNRVKADLERNYYVKNKGLHVVIEETKQRIKDITAKLQKYDERNNQFVQTGFCQSNQKLLFEKIGGKISQNVVKPNGEESRKFWSHVWSQNVEHNKSTEWINEVKESVIERSK